MREARLTNIDVIKIISAFGIVLHHYWQCFNVYYNYEILNIILPYLGYLVELFFLISGYFAAMTLRHGESFLQQYIKKFLRLYPSALLAVITTSVIMSLHYAKFGNCIWGNQYTVPGIITSFFMLNQGWIVEYAPALDNPIWYICVLLWMYALYYIIERIFENRKEQRLKIFIYAIIVLVGGIGWKFRFDFPFLYLSDCRGYAAFFYGILISEMRNKEIIYAKYRRRIVMSLSILGLVISMVFFLIKREFSWYVWVYIFLPSFVMLSIDMPQLRINKTAVLSEVTFELYLWHVVCFYVFQFALDIMQIEFQHNCISTTIATALCMFCAFLIYEYIEKPINKKIRKYAL